jgi:type IV pilus assembly protein PilQ
MRLKQLLGILLLFSVATATAAAAGAQLTQVRVASHDSATTVSLGATGAFTHTEYRPTDNLLLVDLAGVSAAKMDGKTHLVSAPGLVSYRVLGYQSSDGSNVARVELTLAAGSDVKLTEGSDSLAVRIASTAAIAPVAKASAVEIASAVPAHAPKAVSITKVGVVRVQDGVALEILASAPVTPKALKLASPDRLVLDVPNAVSTGHFQTLSVNAGAIKDVRMGRFQANPPVLRIVVDLNQDRDYELAPQGNKLLVKFHEVTSAAASAPAIAPEASPTDALALAISAAMSTPKPVLAATPETGKAVDFAVVHPEMKPVAMKSDPVVKAGDAASHFGSEKKDIFDVAPMANASLPPLASPNTTFQQAAAVPTSASARPKYTGEPISVNLKDVDLKDFFRLIHEISGLNVVLDPQVHGTLTIVLDDVPWDQALDIVLKNNGLDRQLEGNVLRIATVETLRKEADARRAQIEAQALAVDKVTVTRFLSYAHSKDVVPTVKKFLSARGDVVSDDRTNALIIDDIPNTIPKIDELLGKLDRKTAEVEIEARVVAATRNFARDIGTQLGFGWGNNATALNGGPAVGTSPLTPSYFNPPPYFTIPGVKAPDLSNLKPGQPPPTTPAAIPLFSNLATVGATSGATLFNIGRDYRIDFLLTMAESRGLLKILSRPRVVTQNNIQALVRQGVRVPVVTQAQLGGPPTVTYVDAFLRLSVTPQITAENTIFLNVDVENTTPDFSREVQGNPTLVTQQATTQVLVTDGGTVVIGGVIQTQNSVNISQVPLLGNIPILGNLFRHRAVSTNTQELIFFITPRIIQT